MHTIEAGVSSRELPVTGWQLNASSIVPHCTAPKYIVLQRYSIHNLSVVEAVKDEKKKNKLRQPFASMIAKLTLNDTWLGDLVQRWDDYILIIHFFNPLKS